MDLCGQFRLPLVDMVDQPGFVIGTESERRGTIRHGTRAMAAVYQASVPTVAVILRKVFGVAGAAHGNHSQLNLRYAWPSGDWARCRSRAASRPPTAATWRRPTTGRPTAEIEERLNAVRSPFRTAEKLGIEEIIDPRDSSPLGLCRLGRARA